MKSILNTIRTSALVVTVASASLFGKVAVDPTLADYKPVAGVSGNLNSVGSDTLNNLMTLWAEGFKAIYPNVNIQIEGKGSSTAPPALIEGTAQLGPMSRPMKSEEVSAFEKKYGYKPVGVPVALDALAIFVNKDNPLKSLDLAQADSIFSSTYKRGGKPIEMWGQVGLTGDFANRAISIYGRNSASGTYGFFKEHVLKKGDYKNSVKEQPGSSAVVQGIATDLYGIGYSGIGYATAGVHALALADKPGAKAYEANLENALSGDYPLARFLLIYVNASPSQGADTLTKEFIKFILSKQGQEIVVKDGYFPLPSEVANKALQSLSK